MLAVVFAVSLRFRIGTVALVTMLVVGVGLRAAHIGHTYSDVAAVTSAAIDVMLGGGNPYGIGYAQSTPPGAPFAYGPLALLWYLPFDDPRVADFALTLLVLGVLAFRGRPLGLALFATAPVILGLPSDGSNDNSAGVILLVALVVAERLPRAGAFLVGLAIAFKPYAAAWLPPLFVWAGAGALIWALVGAALFWLPAILIWGPGAILHSLRLSDVIKTAPYYSLGQALEQLGIPAPRDFLNVLRFVAGGLTTLATAPFARSHAAMVIGGVLIFMATLYTAFWSTFAYFAAIAPVICWYLDDWLLDDPEGQRIRWPGDPHGGLRAVIDRRWPVRGAEAHPA